MSNPNSPSDPLPSAEHVPEAGAKGPLPDNVRYLHGQEAFEFGGQEKIRILAVDAVQELGHAGLTDVSVESIEAEVTAEHGAEAVADAEKATETLEAEVGGGLLDAITDRKNGGVNDQVAERLKGLEGADMRVLMGAVAIQAAGSVVSLETRRQVAEGLKRTERHEIIAA